MDIPEYKRDESLDYLKILKALMELPFQVGKKLLSDFLTGNYKHPSITKNRLDELHNFNTLHWDKDKIYSEVEKLIKNKMIEQVSTDYNQFVKVMQITLKGRNEVIRPTLNEKKQLIKQHIKTIITEEDKINFDKHKDFLEDYNDEQKKAITSNKENILVLAGAGTGKTTVLTKRIDFLVNKKNVSQSKILAITFTKKARTEMKERLSKLCVNNVDVHTFNSFCENILREYEREVYGKKVRMMSYTEKILAMNMALSVLGYDVTSAINSYYTISQRSSKSPNQLQNMFMNDCFAVLDFFKTTNKKVYDFSNDVELKHKSNAKMIYGIVKYLEEYMQLQGLRNFTDQLIDVINFFNKNESSMPQYDYILIDEYQDVNSSQVQLIKLLDAENIFAVGDPRQSIFGWRGSDINFILHFEDDFKDAEIISLIKNYRSSKNIVKVMNKVIEGMELPDLEHYSEADDKIQIFSFNDILEEQRFVLETIENSIIPLDEIFILARTNKQLNNISEKLKQKSIPHILRTDEVRRPTDNKKGHLTLATIHAIKGLEATKVFVIGANEQNFPCRGSDHPAIEMLKTDYYDKEEEELRLFYVAISRAKEKLYITYTGNKPTKYLKEVGG